MELVGMTGALPGKRELECERLESGDTVPMAQRSRTVPADSDTVSALGGFRPG